MKFVEVIKACESANGSGSKDAIKAHLATLDADGRKLVRYMMDPYMTFGVSMPAVRKLVPAGNFAAEDPADIAPLFRMFDDLSARNLTGNAAKGAVAQVLAAFTSETASYIEKVIDKSAKAGFSADTFNKVAKAQGWPESDLIPSWEEQLAEKCEEVEDFEEKVTFPCRADIKYDGTRQFAFVRAGQPVEYRARGGKPSDHLNGLFDEDLLKVREQVGYDFVLDGETISTAFSGAMNAKGSKNTDAKKSLIFRGFFMMPITDWIAQKTDITNDEARLMIVALFGQTKTVMPTDGRIVNDYADMMAYCNEVIDDETKTTAEREGLILKKGDAVYEWKRSYTWVKVKRFYDVDARIVGIYAAKPKSRLEKLGLPGGVNCVAFLESGERVEFNVGSGFNFEQRASLRDEPELWLKNTHVISYQEISKAKGKDIRSLRFCTLKQAHRTDKLVEI